MHYVKAKGILSSKNNMNLYRGCTHGCIYCDSRSKCYQMDHPFEDVEVKENAIELLEDALKRKRKKCMIGMGSMTDPYMPLEREIRSTRRTLELIYEYGFGAAFITKSDLVLRDIELLQQINERSKCVVQMTLTAVDEQLSRKIEPNVCTTRKRFEVLLKLRDAGIPTVVWLSPVLPFITDTKENLSAILDMCAQAKVQGIISFGMGMTLREGNREYFYTQLDRLFPGLKEQYIKNYGTRYELSSPRSNELTRLFRSTCEKQNIAYGTELIFNYLSQFEEKPTITQFSLWD